MGDDAVLIGVLDALRERGAIGESSLVGAITHAEAFIEILPDECGRLLDLGSGGGLPGLVIALRLPMARITLTERRERRADLLRRACLRLGVDDRVVVRTADVRELALEPALLACFDLVTARSFGPPLWTLRCALPFVRDGGLVVVSNPPAGPSGRWPTDGVARLGFDPVAVHGSFVSRFARRVSTH